MFEEMEIIHDYSRKQALQDGVLIDLGKYTRKEANTFKCSVACTIKVFEIIETNIGLLEDNVDTLFYNLKISAKGVNTDTIIFKYLYFSEENYKIIELKAIYHPGDNFEPVITIMMPDED
jgi:hypothetical protein